MSGRSNSESTARARWQKPQSSNIASDGALHAVDFGCRLVALSGRTGLDGLVHGAEMLSPLLSGLGSDEWLAVEVAVNTESLRDAVCIRGVAHGGDPEWAQQRASHLGTLLHALGKGQFPGFVLRDLDSRDAISAALTHTATLRPSGRVAHKMRASGAAEGPVAVESNADDLVLPAMRLSAEGLTAGVSLLKAYGVPAVLSLQMRLVRFDAAALRRIRLARDEIFEQNPRSQFEALRYLAEAVPSDAVLAAFTNDRCGVELTMVVHSAKPLDTSAHRMLCHAVFRVEPETASTDGGFGCIYPRSFALAHAVGGLAATAALSLQRAPDIYAPPLDDGMLLGKTPDGRPVVITHADRAQHQFIIGATGTGKSTLVLNQIASDMRAGKGMLVLDPHGDLWEAARRLVPLGRQKDLILGHIGDPAFSFSMNVLSGLGGDPATERSATINGLLRLMKNTLWPGVPEAFGPMFEFYFRNALLLLMEANGEEATVMDCARVFQDSRYRRALVEKSGSQATAEFWNMADGVTSSEINLESMGPWIVSKLSPFTTNKLLAPILASPTSTLDLQAAIADGKIVLINLAKGIVGEGSARLIGGLITMRLVAAAQTQMRLPQADRKEFIAYLDEFQTYATEHLAEAIEETRKYKLRLVLACQSLGQINGKGSRSDVGGSVLANIANLVAFRLGVEDAHTLTRWFEPMFKAEDLMYLPNHVAVGRLLINGQAIRPIEFRTSPPPAPSP
jgi:hypothetical protein